MGGQVSSALSVSECRVPERWAAVLRNAVLRDAVFRNAKSALWVWSDVGVLQVGRPGITTMCSDRVLANASGMSCGSARVLACVSKRCVLLFVLQLRVGAAEVQRLPGF